MAHDMNPKGRAMCQFTKATIRGVWKQSFILIVAGAVKHADTDIAYCEYGLPW